MSETSPKYDAGIDAFSEVIRTLESEATDLERRAAKLRTMANDLRAMRVKPAILTIGGTSVSDRVSPVTAIQMQATTIATKPTRTPTSHLIIEALAERGAGMWFKDICGRVIPRIQSQAKNKEKLVHSTLHYLIQNGDVVKDENGLYSLKKRRDG